MINTFSNDVLSNKSLLDLSLEFASSREKLKDLKLNQKKHLIGCMVPNVELICAAKGYPVYPMRMEPFGNQNLLKILDLGKNILGSGLFTNIIQVVRQFDNNNSIDKILHDIIDAVFSQFDNMYNFGVEKG
ncbi:MAG: hypothetical protein GY870_16620, partial [archaeon]|nr:hypothetical protein [archaeon]